MSRLNSDTPAHAPDVRGKYVPPAIDQLAFNCPHCGALAKQFWYSVHAEPLKKDELPNRFDAQRAEELDLSKIKDAEMQERVKRWARQMATGRPLMDYNRQDCDYDLHNVSLSRCFNCDDIAIWIYNRLIWPRRGEASLPNPDLPDDVREDYEEASTILYSRRGELLRSCVSASKSCASTLAKAVRISIPTSRRW